jgi:hypothetical protein
MAALVQPAPAPAPPVADHRVTGKQTLHYGIEWRLIRAGNARLTWEPVPDKGYIAELQLESTGLVSKLYRVSDLYKASTGPDLCAENVHLKAEEGKRRRDTTITFHPEQGKLLYLERDLLKNTVALKKELETPPCVHEYMGALARMRGMRIEPGKSAEIPLTDGKKFANVRVDAQEREQVRVGDRSFNTIRHEVHMFNDVVLKRKARFYVWLTDDERRLPVQMRVKLSVLVGTITMQLEKVEEPPASAESASAATP